MIVQPRVVAMQPSVVTAEPAVVTAPPAVAASTDGDRAARRVYLALSLGGHLAARPGCHKSWRKPSPPG